MQVSSK